MIDPITLEVLREAFVSIVREMRITLVRTAYSSILYEGEDFSCVLMDGQAQIVAMSKGQDHPLHIVPIGWSMRAVRERFGVPRQYADYREMLDAERPDFVTPEPVQLAELTADVLERAGFDVVIVDEDEDRCRRLASTHPYALMIHGDPTDPGILGDLELGKKDVVLALTGWDEVNVLGCLAAKATGSGMVISRFNRIPYVKLLSGVGIDAAISSRLMAASTILRYVRQGRVEQVATFSDTDAEAIEIEVAEGARAVDETLHDLPLPIGVVVGGISRNETTFVPDGSTVIRAGDHIIFFALPESIESAASLFSA